MMLDKIPVITIDGPSGSGKGTLTQRLANHLGWHVLDSGALYRVLGLAALNHSVAIDNYAALEVLAKHVDVSFRYDPHLSHLHIILEGEDVSALIRTEAVGAIASKVAAVPEVRTALFERQRDFKEFPGLVADGRDMGTVIFPEAQLKIFLEADPLIRAQRRFKQLQEVGVNVSLEGLLSEIEERDRRDRFRAISPLVPAKDAVILDTTSLSIDEVFKQVSELARVRELTIHSSPCT